MLYTNFTLAPFELFNIIIDKLKTIKKLVMKKILIYLLLISTISSCKKEFTAQIESSAIKEKTIEWMISKKANTNPLQSIIIDSVMKNLNWDLVVLTQINDSLSSVYIPIHGGENKGLTALYNVRIKSIDSGNLVLTTPLDNKNIINNINVYNANQNNNFTGTISIFSIYNEFESKLGIANGRKIFKAEIRTKIHGESLENKNSNKKSNNTLCYDYYYVTVYSDGTEVWNYLYTSCSNECEITYTNQIASESSIIKSNCVGAGGGTSGIEGSEYDTELAIFETYYRQRMSNAEKNIFDNELTLTQRISYLRNAKISEILSTALYFGEVVNGKGDAFRHSFFVAMNAKSLGPDLAQRLAEAHEMQPGNQLSIEMDRRNNLIGLDIYQYLNITHNDYVSYFSMLNLVIAKKIDNGELWIVSDLDIDGNPTSNSKLIQSNEK